MSEADGKICANAAADIKARFADLERCVSLGLLHHHLQQLIWHLVESPVVRIFTVPAHILHHIEG